jgi:hypothetical protein
MIAAAAAAAAGPSGGMIMIASRLSLALALVGACGLAVAAPSRSVLDLYQAIPQVPATAAEAAKWFDKKQTLVHPGLLQLKADIAAHKRGLEGVSKTGAVEAHAQGALIAENMQKGMADVGIDMERMKTDPAYAQQVQERMRKMSPAEIMAMSQKMNRPMTQDARVKNEAQVMVNDAPAVKAAADAGAAYADGQQARIQAHAKRWETSDQAVKQINSKRPDPGVAKPAMEYDNPGCDKACDAQWNAYADRMLPLLVARDTEVLLARKAVFDQERGAQLAGIKQANQHLLATKYGEAAQAQLHRSRIVGYDTTALGEIELLVTKLEGIVKEAAIRSNCGKQVVMVPQAVCQ